MWHLSYGLRQFSVGYYWMFAGTLSYLTCTIIVRYTLHSPEAVTVWRDEVPLPTYDYSVAMFATAFIMDLLACLHEPRGLKTDFVLLPAYIKGTATLTHLSTRMGWATVAAGHGRRIVILQRYICWMHTTPSILRLLQMISISVSQRQTLMVIILDQIMMITGATAVMMPGPVGVLMGIISHLALLPILWFIHVTMTQAGTQLKAAGPRRVMKVQYYLTMIMWAAFGVEWDLAYFGLVSMRTDEFVVMALDFTAKVMCSSSLMLSSFKQLDTRRAEVMREIETASMLKLKEELETTRRQRDRLLASVSHEMRSPLNGIIGLSQALLNGVGGPLADSVHCKLKAIGSCGAQLLNMVNSLMEVAIAKTSTGTTVAQDPICLCPLVQTILDIISAYAPAEVELVNHVPRGVVVQGNAGHLTQIVNHLVSNAVRHTNKGYVEVTAKAYALEGKVVISVRDTGPGIPTNKLLDIFLPFEQVDGAADTGSQGLGLYLVRELVQSQGGEVWVQSRLNQGSCFSFTTALYLDDRGRKQKGPQDMATWREGGPREYALEGEPQTRYPLSDIQEETGKTTSLDEDQIYGHLGSSACSNPPVGDVHHGTTADGVPWALEAGNAGEGATVTPLCHAREPLGEDDDEAWEHKKYA